MNYNEFLENKVRDEYGDEILNYIKGIKGRKTTFRVNNIKSSAEEVENFLNDLNISYDRVSWFKDAFILNSDIDITELSIYQNGSIYVQGLSSMIPPLVLNALGNDDILDMASSPGSKTTQIASLTKNKCHITACEVNKNRMERLKYNLDKQGVNCCYTMLKDARFLDDFFTFDKVLLDAPCSGSGTITIDSSSKQQFNHNLLDKISKTQAQLLDKAIKVTKKGGIIVYSTCSILKEENEEIIRPFIDREVVEIVPISIGDIPLIDSAIEGTLTVLPTELYEGFFVAKLRKI